MSTPLPATPKRQRKPPSPQRKRNPLPFRQSDVTRAIKGVVRAGFGPIWRVEIKPDGTILIVVGGEAVQSSTTPLDEWLAKHAH